MGDSGLPASPLACLIPPASDDDECRAQPSPCANGRCINTVGSFHCDCDEGYQPSPSLTECQGECDKVPVWHPHLGAPRGRERVGATKGVTQPAQTHVFMARPQLPLSLQSPAPLKGESMSPLPCLSSHPGRGPPQVHHFMGLNLEGTPEVSGVQATYLSWSPVSLSPSLSTLSAPGAQSPPLSVRPSVCIQLSPAPPQPPRAPDAAHPRTSSVPAPQPHLSDALLPTQTPKPASPSNQMTPLLTSVDITSLLWPHCLPWRPRPFASMLHLDHPFSLQPEGCCPMTSGSRPYLQTRGYPSDLGSIGPAPAARGRFTALGPGEKGAGRLPWWSPG